MAHRFSPHPDTRTCCPTPLVHAGRARRPAGHARARAGAQRPGLCASGDAAGAAGRRGGGALPPGRALRAAAGAAGGAAMCARGALRGCAPEGRGRAHGRLACMPGWGGRRARAPRGGFGLVPPGSAVRSGPGVRFGAPKWRALIACDLEPDVMGLTRQTRTCSRSCLTKKSQQRAARPPARRRRVRSKHGAHSEPPRADGRGRGRGAARAARARVGAGRVPPGAPGLAGRPRAVGRARARASPRYGAPSPALPQQSTTLLGKPETCVYRLHKCDNNVTRTYAAPRPSTRSACCGRPRLEKMSFVTVLLPPPF